MRNRVAVMMIGMTLALAGCGDNGGPTIRNEALTQQEALDKLGAEPTENGVNDEYRTDGGSTCEVENVLIGEQTIEFWVDAGESNVLDLGNGIGLDFVAEDEKSQPCMDAAAERLG